MFRSHNQSKLRISSHSENLPPTKSVRYNPISTSRRQRRSRTNGITAVNAKYNLEQAKRRAQKNPVRFDVQCAAMRTQAPAGETTKAKFTPPATRPVVLPRGLQQPAFAEAPAENIRAAFGASENCAGQLPEFCRDMYKTRGLKMLQTVISVSAEIPKNKLPKEMDVLVHDQNPEELPTHMLAVYGQTPGASPSASTKIDVKLYPVHAQLYASHCARLGPFEPSPVTSNSESIPMPTGNGQPVKLTLPVRSIRLPSPQTFPKLSQFLYTKRAEILYDAFLPTPATKFLSAFAEAGSAEPSTSRADEETHSFFTHPQNFSRQLEFAEELARTYTAHTLLERLAVVHGMWMNVCALGIYDDTLWGIMDGCYEVILRALAMGSGVDLDAMETDSA
ncbi:hypothetical protein VNI00_000347 [Paramarasmius palmivorus]|uniref:Clp1 n=1 Tax=Paramarasmius palmivorus TaxID=297713 RepID=A0AAW0EC81_9AGAR